MAGHEHRYTLSLTPVILALIGAFLFGTGVALQFRVASTMPDSESVRISLLARLVRQPLWLVGLVADFAGFGFQAAALANGSLIVVEPLIALSLVFTFIALAIMTRQKLDARELGAAVLVVAGLATFLIVAAPEVESHDTADTASWILCSAVIIVLVFGLAMLSRGRPDRPRGAMLAFSAGIANGFVAVTSKAFAQKLDDDGLVSALQSWQPWALLATGLTATLIIQSAYQADAPTLVFPVIEVMGPLTASCVGVALFNEQLSFTGGRAPIIILALAVMVSGMVFLGREPVIAQTATAE